MPRRRGTSPRVTGIPRPGWRGSTPDRQRRAPMRIGILGAGHIGAAAARLFARAGHEVALSNSRGPASLAGLVDEINREAGAARVKATTAQEAATFGEVVLLAVPWRTKDAWPQAATVRGKIVIDAMNPY